MLGADYVVYSSGILGTLIDPIGAYHIILASFCYQNGLGYNSQQSKTVLNCQ